MGNDHYFNVRDVQGSSLPNNGDSVTFEAGKNQRGLTAKNIQIISHAQNNNSDDRVTCSSCNRKIVPRLVYSNGTLWKSVCPYCGQTYKEFYDPTILFNLIFLMIILIFLVIFHIITITTIRILAPFILIPIDIFVFFHYLKKRREKAKAREASQNQH